MLKLYKGTKAQLFMGLSSTILYTSELILCSTIYVETVLEKFCVGTHSIKAEVCIDN